uniref:Uncharacterized protein n=1 Tax=Oryza punctata TaxID=4537 RepID=A0A0E0LHE8_ORYPU
MTKELILDLSDLTRFFLLSVMAFYPYLNGEGFYEFPCQILDGNNDEGVQNLLCKPNVLEFLEISFCTMLTKIHAPHFLNRLKHLQVDC